MIFALAGFAVLGVWGFFKVLSNAESPAGPSRLILVYAALLVVIYVYLAAYLLRISRSTCFGENFSPSLPNLAAAGDEVFLPAMLFLSVILAADFPYIIYSWVNEDLHFWSSMMPLAFNVMGMFATTHEMFLTYPDALLGWILRSLGMLYFPTAMMAVVTRASLEGLDPRILVRAVARAPGPWAVVLGFTYAKFLVFDIFDYFDLLEEPGFGGIETRLYIGIFLAVATMVYLLMVQARLVGLLYHANRRKLDFLSPD